jgi:hypothetical protein
VWGDTVGFGYTRSNTKLFECRFNIRIFDPEGFVWDTFKIESVAAQYEGGKLASKFRL